MCGGVLNYSYVLFKKEKTCIVGLNLEKKRGVHKKSHAQRILGCGGDLTNKIIFEKKS